MKITILGPINSEQFSASVSVTNNTNESVYKVIFDDRRMVERYGTIEIKKGIDYWKFPTSSDRGMISIASNLIFAIMEMETNP